MAVRCVRALVPALALGAGCATVPRAPIALDGDAADWRAYRDLIDGRTALADAAFAERLRIEPGDLLAMFGRAMVDYERADGAGALHRYATILEAVAQRGPDAPGGWGAELAPVAAARLALLLEEVSDRAAAEDRVLAIHAERLPWHSRIEIGLLAERIARRRGDRALLDRVAAGTGCPNEIRHEGAAGRLPVLDLDAPIRPGSRARPLASSGCRITVPSPDGRPGAQVVSARIATESGLHAIVIDYAGSGRITVDGGAATPFGSRERYPPRRHLRVAQLPAGDHRIEVRLATLGGPAEASVHVIPLGEGARGPDESVARATSPEGNALLAFCRAQRADQDGDVLGATGYAEVLSKQRRFAPGLALAAAIAARDVTIPSSLGYDRARHLLRTAVAVDPDEARSWHHLAQIEMGDDHPREAIESAGRAARASPEWWRPELTLRDAYARRGLERDADMALDRALEKGPTSCAVLDAAVRRAQDRRRAAEEEKLVLRLARCHAESEVVVDRLRARGDLFGAATALRRMIAIAPERDSLRSDLAAVDLALGKAGGAAAAFTALVDRAPRETGHRVRLADALWAAGDEAAARRTLGEALRAHPDAVDLRRAARAAGVPLPIDALRVDGRDVIRSFEASGRRYDSPAVLVLDRTVHQVGPDGAQTYLTHNIVRVQSKQGMERWGEVAVPGGGEVLVLRTHKPDGSTREPEEIGGKATVSAPDLGEGDYLEWETLESRAPSDAFAPGFVGERFYFRSFDAPLDRSEYLLCTPTGVRVDIDQRGGAPAPVARPGPDGTVVRTFAARQAAQVFGERGAVPPVEWLPSVRVSAGAGLAAWARFLDEQLGSSARETAATQSVAMRLRASVGSQDRARIAEALYRWITDNVEDSGDLREPASHTLARRQGGRLPLFLALARPLGIPARMVLARSLSTAAADAPTPAQEVDDFGEPLLLLDLGLPDGPLFADLRLRHAPFGYLGAALAGARAIEVGTGRLVTTRRLGGDDRRVALALRLGAEGAATGDVVEELRGWPAIEWADMLDRLGGDRTRLRQEFEQRWLGLQFPGAVLRDLDVALKDGGAAGARLRYSFEASGLATRGADAGSLELAPTFFRSQAGRRYTGEAERRTTLVLGPDVSTVLDADIALPPGARISSVGLAVRSDVEGPGGLRIVEERRASAGPPARVSIHREARIPLLRVTPDRYARVAADLRRADGAEQAPIRVLVFREPR